MKSLNTAQKIRCQKKDCEIEIFSGFAISLQECRAEIPISARGHSLRKGRDPGGQMIIQEGRT